MRSQSIKDIIASGEYGAMQTISLVLFLLVFVGIAYYVFSRPKKFYQEEENAPLGRDNEEDDINNTLP